MENQKCSKPPTSCLLGFHDGYCSKSTRSWCTKSILLPFGTFGYPMTWPQRGNQFPPSVGLGSFHPHFLLWLCPKASADGCETLHQLIEGLSDLSHYFYGFKFQPSFWWCRILQPSTVWPPKTSAQALTRLISSEEKLPRNWVKSIMVFLGSKKKPNKSINHHLIIYQFPLNTIIHHPIE